MSLKFCNFDYDIKAMSKRNAVIPDNNYEVIEITEVDGICFFNRYMISKTRVLTITINLN